MDRNKHEYEPPKTTIYRFDENDKILTESGEVVKPVSDFSASALNRYFGGKNTTLE